MIISISKFEMVISKYSLRIFHIILNKISWPAYLWTRWSLDSGGSGGRWCVGGGRGGDRCGVGNEETTGTAVGIVVSCTTEFWKIDTGKI